MTFRTRFAPSPTGPLHLGHAYSAILAHDLAVLNGGEFLLRIEDIDQSRSRPEWEELIYQDLEWLGLEWTQPVMRQSERKSVYRAALSDLWDRELIYPCWCNRKDILQAVSAPHEGDPPMGPDGIVYPGTCRGLAKLPNHMSPMPADAALRLDMSMATEISGVFEPRIDSPSGGGPSVASFRENGDQPTNALSHIEFDLQSTIEGIGDVVIARRDMGTSYHLSVVLDDAAQGITHVVRGSDLFEATRIHIVLQGLLHLPTPIYHHHKLIRDEKGKRLAKRDDARAIRKYREDGHTPDDIRRMVGLTT